MWSELFNDKVKAEAVSVADYEHLRVNRGRVIHATRTFKALNFKDILKDHLVEKPDRYLQPRTSEGGWNKFIKTNITNNVAQRRAATYEPIEPTGKHPKNSGRGWLHK
jgi:hypothetical protein